MKSLLISIIATVWMAMPVISTTANDAVDVMKKFYETADARPLNFDTLSKFYSESFVDHHPNPSMPVGAPTGIVFQMIAAGAPDSSHKIELIIPSGDDKAIIVWSHEGTNTNYMFGIPSQDPALPFAIAGIEIWRVKDGKITDRWHVEDIAGLGAQLSKPQTNSKCL